MVFKWLALLCLSFSFISCSKVLSHRTDEEAWVQFDKEVKNSRTPSSESPAQTSLHEALANIQVRGLLLKCGTQTNSSTCYRNALVLQFDEVYRAEQKKFPDLKVADYKREQKTFFEFRSYDSVTSEVNRFHQSILSGLELTARTHAKDLFSDCAGDGHKDSTIENFTVLSNLSFEMPKGTYACLSERWTTDQKVLLDETSDRLGLSIVTDEAKLWIRAEQISPIYESEVSQTIEKKTHDEQESFTRDQKTIFDGLDAKAPQDQIVKEWSAKLREKYPYSPVEQWIVSYLTKPSVSPAAK